MQDSLLNQSALPSQPKLWRQPAVWLIVAAWLVSFVVLLCKTVPVSGDGIYYYVYLRSLVQDGDLNFSNDLAHFVGNPHVAKQLESGVTTPTGLTPNLFSIGPALLWSPVFFVVRVVSLIVDAVTPGMAVTLNGFSRPELLAPSIATSLYGLAGLLLCNGFVRRVLPGIRANAAALAVLITFFGSNLVYYLTFEASMSHGLGFFVVSLLLFLWHKWRPSKTLLRRDWWRWLVLGLVAGLVVSVRWQLLGVVLVVPTLDLLAKKFAWRNLARLVLVIVGGLIAFTPQLLAWKTLYGSAFVIPQGRGFLDLSSPHFSEVLFSSRHGLFVWTPLAVIAACALFVAATQAKTRMIAMTLLLIAIVQTYINGTAIEWWGGEAFGARRFTDIAIVGVVGVAFTLRATWHRRALRNLTLFLMGLLMGGNLLLMQLYRHQLISRDQPVGLSDVIRGIKELF
jgi:hypothetical protein